MKPEKVKSRWRRSSEMENGEKSAVSPEEIEREEVSSDTSTLSILKESIIEDPESLEKTAPKLGSCIEDTSVIFKSIPKYVELEENLYLFERKRTKRKKEVRRILCECSLTEQERQNGLLGCRDECLNRLLMIECGSRCATGESCSNKRFQKRQYARAIPFKTDKKGWGLKLLEDIPVGNFVIEYVGEVLSRHDFKQRVKQYAREKSNHYYFMALKTDEILDATHKGNLSRFMNHSCEPNCETQKWTVNGELRIGFFAKRDLKTGEELTFDYQFQRYGREAQKCFCAKESCSGYIGVTKQIPLDVTNKVVNKRKKRLEEKKREDLEDSILEEEIEKLCENGSLRNKNETLTLSRLMVRAEDSHSRNKLLDVILGTLEIGCLRSFLDYHGLSLLWSWMVDLTDANLKTKILNVLSILPVPNKTMLLDSKIYNIVERWSTNSSKEEVQHSGNNPDIKNFKLSETKKLKSCDTSDSETDMSVFQTLESNSISLEPSAFSNRCELNKLNINKNENLLQGLGSDPEESSITTNSRVVDTSRSDEDSGELADEGNNKSNFEILHMASNLLSSWKDLKEVFKIPRRERPRFKEFFSRYSSKPKRDRCKLQHKISVVKEFRLPRDRNSYASYHDRNWDFPSNVTEKPRKVLLPTPIVLTKEERRLQFEKEVMKNDQRKAFLKQQEFVNVSNTNGSTENNLYSSSTSYFYGATDVSYLNSESGSQPFISSEGNIIPLDQFYLNSNELQSSRPALLPTPGTANTVCAGSLSAIDSGAAIYMPNVVYHSSHSQASLIGPPPPTIPQQPVTVAAPSETNHVPPSSNLIVVGNVDSSPIVPTLSLVNSESIAPTTNAAIPSTFYAPIQNSSEPVRDFPTSVAPQYITSQEQFITSQHENFYPQTQCTIHLSEQNFLSATLSYDANCEATVKALNTQLPPNWKAATDPDGNIYYYHNLTRQTQWNPPIFEEAKEDVDGDTPTFDEPKEHKQNEIQNSRSHKKHLKKKSTTTAPADTSSNATHNEITKKIKELFRTKMSSFVVQCLNPYHRDDCRIGKITTNEDFKHLARKLTHFVMAKELKHCKNVEDLECNDNVKHKARDFIHKYMSKYGPIYKRDKYDSPYTY